MMCSVLGKHVPYSTCKKWFQLFKSGNFNFHDEKRPGQPKKVNNDFFLKWNLTALQKITQMCRKRGKLFRRLGNYSTFYKLTSKFSEKDRELNCAPNII